MTSLHAIHPSATLAQAGANDVKSIFGQSGLDWFSLNAATPSTAFANILNSLTSNANANATPSNDPVTQLAALVQNGTPLSTIVNQIAQSVSSSVQQHLAGTQSQSALDSLRSSLLQSITNALSPPSNAPPGTATQQVTALAARLQQVIAAIARETQNNAGQQNEIPGTVLDANSAKEPPAQQKTNDTPSPLDVSSLVRSILSNALTALQGAPSQVPTLKANPLSNSTLAASTPVVAPPPAPVRAASLPVRIAPLSPHTNPTLLASSAAVVASPTNPVMPANGGGTSASSQTPVETTSAAPITMANAPDLLARMLVRAAGADPNVTGNAGAATAQGGNGSSGTTLSATTIAARFAAAISDAVASASPSQDGQTSANWFGRGFAGDDQTSSATTQNTSSGTNAVVAMTNASATAQLQNLVQPQQAAGSSVDVSSVLEQMVKSMSMRTDTQGTSTISLHLQPENLGDVTMKITVTGTQISANVIAQNADVRSALVSNHQQLTKSLADAGLTLTGFSVDVSGGDSKQQNQGQTSGFGRRYVVHELGGNATSEESTVSNLGPPLLSGASLGLFNYLA